MNICFNGTNWAFDDQPNADRSRQVENHVAVINSLRDRGILPHAVNRIVEIRMLLQVLDIADASSREIIENEYRIASCYIRISQMGSDEAGSPGDQYTNKRSLPL